VSQGLDRVKKRIRSVQSTRKITNSMKLVSSVKLRKMTKIVTSQSIYFDALKKIVANAVSGINSQETENPLLIKPVNGEKDLYVVITSNMGLCGGYNNNIIKFFKENIKPNDEVVVIGEKGYSSLKNEKEIGIYDDFKLLCKDFDLTKSRALSNDLISKFVSGRYKSVQLVYTKYKNSICFIPQKDQILPLIFEEGADLGYEPIYEGGREEILNKIVPLYLSSMIYSSAYTSLLSEESSRRNAMDNADKNAQELVEKLNLEYNKARQAAITQEITEVVNGSLAVK